MATAGRCLTLLLIASGMVVLAPATALACSCVSVTDEEALERSDVVFAGYVIKGEYPEEARTANDTLREIRWTFLPDALVKGVDAGPVEVMSESQGSACGVSFSIGRRYLVFAVEDGGTLTTNSCDRTRGYFKEIRLVGAREVPGMYGPATERGVPGDGSGSKTLILSLGGAAFVLLAVGMVFARKRRTRPVE